MNNEVLKFPYHRCPMSSTEILWFFKIDVTQANRARSVRNLATKHSWKILQLSDGDWIRDPR